MTELIYKYIQVSGGGYIANAYDAHGKKIGEAFGSDMVEAKKKAETDVLTKVRLKQRKKVKKKVNKTGRKKKKGKIHEHKGSVMSGLTHVTSARNWKIIK
jgi:hypothetical protein